jgi:hypothetical protein
MCGYSASVVGGWGAGWAEAPVLGLREHNLNASAGLPSGIGMAGMPRGVSGGLAGIPGGGGSPPPGRPSALSYSWAAALSMGFPPVHEASSSGIYTADENSRDGRGGRGWGGTAGGGREGGGWSEHLASLGGGWGAGGVEGASGWAAWAYSFRGGDMAPAAACHGQPYGVTSAPPVPPSLPPSAQFSAPTSPSCPPLPSPRPGPAALELEPVGEALIGCVLDALVRVAVFDPHEGIRRRLFQALDCAVFRPALAEPRRLRTVGLALHDEAAEVCLPYVFVWFGGWVGSDKRERGGGAARRGGSYTASRPLRHPLRTLTL